MHYSANTKKKYGHGHVPDLVQESWVQTIQICSLVLHFYPGSVLQQQNMQKRYNILHVYNQCIKGCAITNQVQNHCSAIYIKVIIIPLPIQ